MDFIEAKLELPLNGGHVFATVAHKVVVHVHATGHTSGDGVCNAVDLKAKKGDREEAALLCGLERTVLIRTRKCRFERKLSMKMGKRPLIPRSYRSRIMPYRHVVSHAFSRSTNTATACCFLMKALRRKVSNLTR